MTLDQLTELAAEVTRRWPGAELVRNAVGNLAVLVDGYQVGYLDLTDGTVEAF